MIVPRRVRRRLLLPPGWVALGFLLLLGCWQLRFWERQLRQVRVLQLTMPALKPKKSELQLFGRKFEKEYKIMYMSPTQLSAFRNWYDTELKGNEINDFLNAATTESAVRKIIADINHANGVRIRFLPGATYANLVEALTIMNRTDQKKYWLDIRHQPTTLYAITVRQEPSRNTVAPFYLGCCTCGPYMPKQNGKLAGLVKIKSLWVNPWRPTTSLLVLIGALSLLPLLHRRSSFFPNS